MTNYKKIIKTFGTPTYCFDVNTLLKRIDYLKEKLKNENLVYAIKANTFIAKEIENSISRYEICSPGEYDICQKLKIDPQKMVISGVYKDYESMAEMIKNSSILRYTVESMNQWNLLKELTKKHNKKIDVLIRLTSGNQFGLTKDELFSIIQSNTDEMITIKGIEYFSGTQKHSLKRIEKEVDTLLEIVEELRQKFNMTIEEIEYGPGLPIFYFQDDSFDEEKFLSELSAILAKIQHPKLFLEIGRSIAASCGSYLTKVVDMKTNKNGNFVILDGGIHHLVYYGQTMAMRIPHFELISQNNNNPENYNLYGSLCTINDCLVKNLTLPKLQIGDTIIFKDTGAYSVTEGISLFLSRDLPKIVLIHKSGNLILLRDTIKTSEINFPNYESEGL